MSYISIQFHVCSNQYSICYMTCTFHQVAKINAFCQENIKDYEKALGCQVQLNGICSLCLTEVEPQGYLQSCSATFKLITLHPHREERTVPYIFISHCPCCLAPGSKLSGRQKGSQQPSEPLFILGYSEKKQALVCLEDQKFGVLTFSQPDKPS